MSDVIVYLAARRQSASSSMPVEHPAGVTLPFDAPTDAALITPAIRGEIRSGAYSADLVRRLPDAVIPGDRVLVIGGGLGVVSTLVARVEGVGRVIVAEPNTLLFPYIDRVHDLNGVSEVETINAVLAVGKKGKIPFCAQRDPRTSSLMPPNQLRRRAMMVPFVDLNMILAEERISSIICDTPTAPEQLLAQADLRRVDRILLNIGKDAAQCPAGDGVCTQLVARGYHPEPSRAAILLRRSITRQRVHSGLHGSGDQASFGL
jgi:FkbM family methyltransferase